VHINQQAHQLGHRNRGMRVVELDRNAVGQAGEVAIFPEVAAQQILQRGGGEEVFLPQAQFLAGRAVVAGIQDLGDRLGPDLFRQGANVVAAVEGV
jgi:hypothetical protein